MKILIFGCGVIGSVYAVHFAAAGYDISVYARGKRLSELRESGLLYKDGNKVKKATVTIADTLEEKYDYVFVTVKNEQAGDALNEVKVVRCNNIVTMINNPYGYDSWNRKLGKNRLIPAFPGAGGVIEDGILNARLTPAMIQVTTFGELNGKRTKRIYELGSIFRDAKVPFAVSSHMKEWQLCHLGLVIPLADAIYRGGGDNIDAGKNNEVMLRTAMEIHRNLTMLKKSGCNIEPSKINAILKLPPSLIAWVLSKLYCSSFGAEFIYGHASKAKTEMMTLRRDFYRILKEKQK